MSRRGLGTDPIGGEDAAGEGWGVGGEGQREANTLFSNSPGTIKV